MNRYALPFQSAAFCSSSDMIPMDNYFASPPMFLPGNSSIITTSTALIQPGNSSGSSFLLDSVAGLNHDTGLAVEWSVDEHYILEDGLEKYKEEPNILKYIKIAASLRDKTVRDVALRCRWMQRKRRKPEEHNSGKRVNNRKTMATYPPMMHHLDQNERMHSEGICGTTINLLKQNAQTLSQITSNLSAYKLQDNIDLFCRARNNITAMLNNMRDTPGLMSHMPLPISVNEDLANSIFPGATNALHQTMIFSSPGGIHLKQEPRC
ncbi:hypothetical protein V6N12_006023 [Hibiscus sabdariffa]|uniref:Uncharacterized protein n=1 Tax=Hibiscus sabdariffa TaxID=183260 RepID=A0ABR2EWS0_9ROSI